jgi:hypothetical protein
MGGYLPDGETLAEVELFEQPRQVRIPGQRSAPWCDVYVSTFKTLDLRRDDASAVNHFCRPATRLRQPGVLMQGESRRSHGNWG